MTDEQKERMSNFGYSLTQTTGFCDFALQDDEMLCELGSRGCSRERLEELREAAVKVADVFYKPPTRPIGLH